MHCLILNSDGNPQSLLPLSTVSWEEAIRYLVLEKGTVLEWYEDWEVHSTSWTTRVPAVIIVNEYVKPKSTIRFSKANVFLRDRFICQYCDKKLEKRECTLDHVLPVSRGGKTSWNNTVTACSTCNANKGNNHKITPKRPPYKPSYFDLVEKRRTLRFDFRHPSWANYV